MESRSPKSAIGFLVVLASIGAVACSSVQPRNSGRQGVFDRLARGSHGNPERPEAASEGDEEEKESGTPPRDLAQIQSRTSAWRWPLSDIFVTSQYGRRGSDFHEGIDLRAKVGTPVYAVDNGVVAYSDARLRGYGKMVVIRHKHGLSTVYAHNSRLLVRKGQRVKKGAKIAVSGSTGRSRGPHVHFEVRKGVAALDPLVLMPDRARALAQAPERPVAKPKPRSRRSVAIRNKKLASRD